MFSNEPGLVRSTYIHSKALDVVGTFTFSYSLSMP